MSVTLALADSGRLYSNDWQKEIILFGQNDYYAGSKDMKDVKADRSDIHRRDFLGLSICTPLMLLGNNCSNDSTDIRLEQSEFIGSLKKGSGDTPLEGANWYEALEIGDGIAYHVPRGALAEAKYVTADMLLDGNHMFAFWLAFKEGEDGPETAFRWAGLNQCSFRVRFPLQLLDLNRWGINREGAFLKPRVYGDRVDLSRVDRVYLTVYRKSPKVARWCMTDLLLTKDEPKLITEPILPKGPLLDELGQSTIHDWPTKSKSVEEVTGRIRRQLERAPQRRWPESFSRWGGWKSKKLTPGAGYFRTCKEEGRWWLVDPDGYPFWSIGVDCFGLTTASNLYARLEAARYEDLENALTWLPDWDGDFRECFRDDVTRREWEPEKGKFINYIVANMIRTFGAEEWLENWATIGFAELRRLRFNTVGNWSNWEEAKKVQFPYVRPMVYRPKRAPFIYRDFPDVFHPEFPQDAEDYARTLESTANDPAFIGYFLMNEPKWGFSKELPAAGMLFVTEECHTRRRLASFLEEKYVTDSALSAAWKTDITFNRVAAGPWTVRLTDEANSDLEEFSVIMADVYFRTLSAACRKADPNHLNLGMRWAGVPPMWAVEGMKSFDVFSMNCYMDKVPRDTTDAIHDLLEMPVIIGEWHFGALDVGLPASGIGHLNDQVDRGKAYRVYLEDAAANSNCIGAHWFSFYDESAIGRHDGENYNIGFLDVCHRPYAELSQAARISHERIYELAAGKLEPYDDTPEYLPKLF
jgi:hypothetical protein